VSDRLSVRRGGPNDGEVLIDVFDDAVASLVARGQPEQCGTEPFSKRYTKLLLTRRRCAGQGLGTRLIEIARHEARVAGHDGHGSMRPARSGR